MSSTNSAIRAKPIFHEYPRWVPTFSHPVAPPRLPLFRRKKNTTPASPPTTAGNIPAQTIHNPPKVYIMYVMRLSRKQSSNAAKSPAVKLDKKNHTKRADSGYITQKIGLFNRFLFYFTNSTLILPIQKHARQGTFLGFFTYFTHFTNKLSYIE